MMQGAPVCVVETPEFIAETRRIMNEEEHAEMIDYLALSIRLLAFSFRGQAVCESSGGERRAEANSAARG